MLDRIHNFLHPAEPVPFSNAFARLCLGIALILLGVVMVTQTGASQIIAAVVISMVAIVGIITSKPRQH